LSNALSQSSYRVAMAFACALAIVTVLVLAACTSAPAIPHETLTSNPEPLRARFNRDAGHVRVVMLAART